MNNNYLLMTLLFSTLLLSACGMQKNSAGTVRKTAPNALTTSAVAQVEQQYACSSGASRSNESFMVYGTLDLNTESTLPMYWAGTINNAGTYKVARSENNGLLFISTSSSDEHILSLCSNDPLANTLYTPSLTTNESGLYVNGTFFNYL
jgi:hypothetical protein